MSIGGIKSTRSERRVDWRHREHSSLSTVILRGELIGSIESTLACPGTTLEHGLFLGQNFDCYCQLAKLVSTEPDPTNNESVGCCCCCALSLSLLPVGARHSLSLSLSLSLEYRLNQSNTCVLCCWTASMWLGYSSSVGTLSSRV
jgi:hypothetical protein